MNHVKKMILVPHETASRLAAPSTTHDQMSALDTEMSHILRKKYVDDSEKWKKYNETLQRYLHFAGEQRKPLEIELKDESSGRDTSFRDQLQAVVPKTYKNQALRIFDYIFHEGSPVSIQDSGTVSIHGTPLPQSNIIDLISDLTRYRVNFQPSGVPQFIDALASMNFPLELVGNLRHRRAIQQARQTGSGSEKITEKIVKKKRIIPKKSVPKQHAWKTW